MTGFINAQRGLDGTGSKDTDILAKVLENLFASASLPTADGKQRNIAEGLNKAVEEIQGTIDADFRKQLGRLMPTIKDFGYPGLDGDELRTETRLDVKRLLSNHTKVQYMGYSGVHLPEAYNGLGFRNLLFILLQVVGFYRSYRAQEHAPAVHLVFIEEPEAHLHPQMQEVFIRHLKTLAAKLCEKDGEDGKDTTWPVQFVVSTHSSHVANEASFEAIRYFAVTSKDQPVGVRRTEVKDLSTKLKGQTPEHLSFLHQYLTLTRCDLFFADKAVLIEGTSERLMLPQIVRKLDEADKALKLTSQYITIMEVGGAYAHIFFPLLDFLDLRTLIVTDLDAVKSAKKNKKKCWVASAVHQGEWTSNSCLKAWFKDTPEKKEGEESDEEEEEIELVDEDELEDEAGADETEGEAEAAAEPKPLLSPAELIAKEDKAKIKGNRRIAYQVPEEENGPCGRTFEDAFMLANGALFGIAKKSAPEMEEAARKKAAKEKKSKFALTYAIEQKKWETPRYLKEGLEWLAGGNVAVLDPNLAMIAQAAATPNTSGGGDAAAVEAAGGAEEPQ